MLFERDVSREIDFMTAAYQHCTGRLPASVLEIACGPGYHSRAFARRGLRAIGLDLNPAMISLAQEKSAAEGLAVTWLETDMRQFQLDAPVDLVFCIFDGLDALQTDDDVIHHFQTVARNLTPAGLYIIDLTHARDCSFGHYSSFRYSGQREGVAIEIKWATNNPCYDLVTGTAHVELEMHVNDHGRQLVIHDSANERLFFPPEIRLLARLSQALQVVGWYGDFILDQPLDFSPASRRMVGVLQKI